MTHKSIQENNLWGNQNYITMADDEFANSVSSNGQQQKRKPRSTAKSVRNHLQAGIMTFLSLRQPSLSPDVKDLPKRYTRYGSLLLLGPTFRTHSVLWAQFFDSLTEQDKHELFRHIVVAFRDGTLTHVAINAPISATKVGSNDHKENIVRSPSNLDPVYGDFGPDANLCDEQFPSSADLDNAYWTSTDQFNSIVQVWAPRWTMFSRGNMSEKARILQGGHSNSEFQGLSDTELGQNTGMVDVVDFYIGIGYFAFCYLERGIARVWGWDINGWSVEGLRRGCVKNGWGVRVIKIDDGGIAGPGVLESLASDIKGLTGTIDAIRCIVFFGDNKWASKVMSDIQTILETDGRSDLLQIRHCNLGLLPTSRASWQGAVQLLNTEKGGWLHIHENVESSAILTKEQRILEDLRRIARVQCSNPVAVDCCHVEQVKTYAPGVIHCVYDINVYPL